MNKAEKYFSALFGRETSLVNDYRKGFPFTLL